MEEAFVYRHQKKMRRGYTTGTCAAAASGAAASMLFSGQKISIVSFQTPKGIRLSLEVEEITSGPGWVSCAVRKDGGDDPDVTHGMLVFARVEIGDDGEKDAGWYTCGDKPELKLKGGPGVGTVTKPGLACPVGMAAINPVPRSMIFSQAEEACRKAGFTGKLRIVISIPGGEKQAEKTFNPHLGIVGGLSVLGTTGIVEPMSEAALIETIRLSLKQTAALGKRDLIVVPGNYGERFLEKVLGLDLNQGVKCSNYIGETLDMAVELGFQRLLLVGHGGKLVKLAAGIMNTHSSQADGRREILAAYGAACGASRRITEEILQAATVDQGLDFLEEENLREPVMERIMERIDFYIKKRAGGSLQAEALLFTNEKGVLGMTPGAGKLLGEFQANSEKT